MKQINLNALADVSLAQRYADQIIAVGKALVANQQQGATNKKAGEGTRDTVKDTVVAYANQTAADGIPAPQANAALRTGLQEMGFPQGTALNYGRAVEGFRKIAETGKDKDGKPLALKDATLKHAQAVMESPETARKNKLRKDIGQYVSAASEAQLKDIFDLVSNMGIALKATRAAPVTVTEGDATGEGETAPEQAEAAAA